MHPNIPIITNSLDSPACTFLLVFEQWKIEQRDTNNTFSNLIKKSNFVHKFFKLHLCMGHLNNDVIAEKIVKLMIYMYTYLYL